MMDRNKAYTDLLMRHRNMLWGLCWQRSGGDRDRCCDLLQEVSIALWENFDKLRPESTPEQERAWVCWQARSVFYQIGRRQELSTEPLSENFSDSFTEEDTQQRKELLEELLSSLDPDEQRMLRLYLEGYRGDEIGKEMGISRDNFYQRMHRAIEKMRSVVLILFVLLLTSGVAIAIVPQWRHLLFGSGKPEATVVDTLQEEPEFVPEPIPFSEPVAQAPKSNRDPLPERQSVEPLPSLSLLESTELPEEVPPHTEYDSLAVSVDDSHLIIRGAEGEWIRVFDNKGWMVAAEVAGRVSIIDLSLYRTRRLYLRIGDRPTIRLKL